jgi:hypothetical protein
MAQLNVSELDFDDIKANLKTFLQSQSEFEDYNFEGSALSVLIDMLSYNTHYNGMIGHMLANENFIDTAIKRESVVSIAKGLGYTPRSHLGSTATVSITVTPPSTFSSTTLVLSRGTALSSAKDGKTYSFYPIEDVTTSAVVNNGVTQFVFDNVLVKEGRRVSNEFTVPAANISGPYTIPNNKVDTTTIRAQVQESLSDLSVSTWPVSSTMLDVKADTKTFWIEEGIDGLFQLRFGDGVIGKKLDTGNLLIVDYIASSGAAPNGCKTFACSSTISAATETVSITTSSPASGGAIQESIDEIRFNAPRFNSTRDRAVTEQDYKTLILASNSNIQSVSVWGGEKNDPPMYGRVFISLNPVSGQIITEQDKDNIKNGIIDPKTPVAIMPVFVDPEYTYLSLNIGVTYDPKQTILSKGQIENAAKSAVNEYFNTKLNKLNKSFYYSRIHNLINDSTDSIISTNIQIGLQKRVKPILNSEFNYTVKFNQKLQPQEVTSTYFNINVSDSIFKVSLQDVPDATVEAPFYSGTGVINAITTDGGVVASIGTIDYDAGTINIPSTIITSLYSTEADLRINAGLHKSVKDITTQALVRTSEEATNAVVAKPSRNTVLTLNDSIIDATINTLAGLTITATTEVEEV